MCSLAIEKTISINALFRIYISFGYQFEFLEILEFCPVRYSTIPAPNFI